MSETIKKLIRNVTGAFNDLIDGTANTGREARQIVRDLGDKITATQSAYIDVKANLVLLNNKRDAAQKESDKWKEHAQKAVTNKRDDLAREALTKKQDFDKQVRALQNNIDALKPQVDVLEGQIRALQERHDEMSNNTDLLEARSESAKAQQKAGAIISGLNADEMTGEFDSLTKRVQKEEARAQVLMEGAKDKKLSESIEELDNHESIEEELAQLKKGEEKPEAA